MQRGAGGGIHEGDRAGEEGVDPADLPARAPGGAVEAALHGIVQHGHGAPPRRRPPGPRRPPPRPPPPPPPWPSTLAGCPGGGGGGGPRPGAPPPPGLTGPAGSPPAPLAGGRASGPAAARGAPPAPPAEVALASPRAPPPAHAKRDLFFFSNGSGALRFLGPGRFHEREPTEPRNEWESLMIRAGKKGLKGSMYSRSCTTGDVSAQKRDRWRAETETDLPALECSGLRPAFRAPPPPPGRGARRRGCRTGPQFPFGQVRNTALWLLELLGLWGALHAPDFDTHCVSTHDGAAGKNAPGLIKSPEGLHTAV